MWYQTLVFGMLFLACAVQANPHNIDSKLTENDRIFRSIPEPEKKYFVTYHLARGYKACNPGGPRVAGEVEIPQHLQEKFEKMDTPLSFSFKLFVWTKENFYLSENDIAITRSVRNIVCFPDYCIDASDVSSHCCPF